MNLRIGAVHAGTLVEPASSPRERSRSAEAEKPEKGKTAKNTEVSSRLTGSLIHLPRKKNGVDGKEFPDVTCFVRISVGCTELAVVQPDINGNIDIELVGKADRAAKRLLGGKKNPIPRPQEIEIEIFHKFVPYKKDEENDIREVTLETMKKTVTFTDGGLKLGKMYVGYAYQPEDPAQMNLPPKDQLFDLKNLVLFVGKNSGTIFELFAALGDVKITEAVNSSTIKRYVDSFMNLLGLSKGKDNETPAMMVQRKFNNWFNKPYAEIPHTPENFIKIITSTVACLPRTIIDGKAVWNITWGNLERDIPGSLADVKVIAQIDPNREDAPILEEIHFKFDGKEGDPGTQIWRKNGESNVIGGFDRASFVARSQFTYLGQIQEHLGKGHLALEVFVEAIFRNLSDAHPVKIYLKQNLEGTEQINKVGAGFGGEIKPGETPSKTLEDREGAVFGAGSVLAGGSLTPKSLNQAIKAAIDRYVGWKGYSPPIPLANATRDYFAHAENQYYEEMKVKVGDFVKSNEPALLSEDIKLQFLHMSEDMVENNPKIPPIYTVGMTDEEYKQNLVDFITYIHMLINHHSLRHATQYVLANVKNCSLAIQGEALKKVGDEYVFAEDGNTDPHVLAQVLFLMGFLMSAELPTMFDSNYNIDPGVVEANTNLLNGALKDMQEQDLNHTDPRKTRLKSVPI